jgi:hypothetical protein
MCQSPPEIWPRQLKETCTSTVKYVKPCTHTIFIFSFRKIHYGGDLRREIDDDSLLTRAIFCHTNCKEKSMTPNWVRTMWRQQKETVEEEEYVLHTAQVLLDHQSTYQRRTPHDHLSHPWRGFNPIPNSSTDQRSFLQERLPMKMHED